MPEEYGFDPYEQRLELDFEEEQYARFDQEPY